MHSVEEIKNGVYWMGCNDFVTPLFERIFPLPAGVSYNSYFIDDERTCVLDGIDKSCRDEFLEDVAYLLKGRKLDYFIIQHMEPDHASSALALIEKYPDVKIVGRPSSSSNSSTVKTIKPIIIPSETAISSTWVNTS